MEFSSQPLPDTIIKSMMTKKIWQDDCPVPLGKLRLLTISHYDFSNQLQQGQIIVHEKLAESGLIIFRELFNLKFPIDKMKLIDEYNGYDDDSMADNNSSGFNFRKIAGSDVISMHAYGLAIDINPLQNPYIILGEYSGELKVWPAGGENFLNRTNQRAGMLEPCVGLFQQNGFDVWGGSWNLPIDYHHFQVNRKRIAEFVN